jgi:hypothetical protein
MAAKPPDASYDPDNPEELPDDKNLDQTGHDTKGPDGHGFGTGPKPMPGPPGANVPPTDEEKAGEASNPPEEEETAFDRRTREHRKDQDERRQEQLDAQQAKKDADLAKQQETVDADKARSGLAAEAVGEPGPDIPEVETGEAQTGVDDEAADITAEPAAGPPGPNIPPVSGTPSSGAGSRSIDAAAGGGAKDDTSGEILAALRELIEINETNRNLMLDIVANGVHVRL